MEDQSINKTSEDQVKKTWCSPSVTRWEVEESLELNPIKLIAEFNQTLTS